MKLFLLILFATVNLMNCGENRSRSEKRIIGKASRVPVELVTRNEISLQDGAPKWYSPIEINSFQYINDKMYILDSVRLQQAYIYNSDGSLNQLVAGPGQGPGEYRLPGGFCLSDNQLHLISAGKKYNIYDSKGNILKVITKINPGGIGNLIHPGPDGSAFLTVYSRHVPDATIFHIDKNGELLNKFSPPDSDFVLFWDMVAPMGNIIVMEDKIAQVFIHKYEVLFFQLDGSKIETIPLASNIYKIPDYEEAKKLKSDRKALQRFMKKYSLINRFFKFGNYFVTVLANTSLSEDKEIMEFWDKDFLGIGRSFIEEDEKLVGIHDKTLVFYNTTKKTLLFRELREKTGQL